MRGGGVLMYMWGFCPLRTAGLFICFVRLFACGGEGFSGEHNAGSTRHSCTGEGRVGAHIGDTTTVAASGFANTAVVLKRRASVFRSTHTHTKTTQQPPSPAFPTPPRGGGGGGARSSVASVGEEKVK